MFARLIVQLPVWLTVAGSAAATRPRGHGTCRYIPGDAGWPSLADWQQLNHTVEGRLIATDPLGDVCHDKGPFEAYNATACAALASAITTAGAQTFEHVPGEILDPYFQNLSCSAFTPADWSCELGERAVYSIDVRTAGDVQAGLAFAREKNIRLVIKSTGIDYMGKSTGQGSLALWLWNLNTTEIIPTYTSQSYSGAAIKLGPGAISGDAILVAAAAGYRFVGPECGLVGIAGGYTQGGGHSQLATEYGLAADQTLEWEVVTAEGEYLVATPEQNSDLYWALSGGGGGTYGVVLSMIVKAYPDGPFAGGSLIFTNTNETAYWKALDIWFSLTPSFVDGTPNNVQFIFNQDEFLGFSLTLPNQTTSAIDALLGPFLAELQSLDITYNISSYESATYIEHYIQSYGPLPYGSLCPDYVNIASRLIPRSTVLNPVSNSNLMAVYKSILADANFTIGCSILNVAEIPSHPANAVLPAWREAIAYCNPQSAWDWENPLGSVADKEKLVSHYFPAIEEATPGSGVNLNEMDPLYQGSWKDTMYGINYARLLEIKHANDPYNLLYAKFAVGSDEFTFDQMGRLCNLT